MNKADRKITNIGSIYFRSEDDSWGQPPASHYSLTIKEGVMSGSTKYIVTSSFHSSSPNQQNSSLYFFVDAPTIDLTTNWESLSDHELKALYDEFASEDRDLADSGLNDYLATLDREDKAE